MMATKRIVISSKSSETTTTHVITGNSNHKREESFLPFKGSHLLQAKDQMSNRRLHKGHRLCTRFGWKFGLRTCMIAALRLCQFLTLAHPNPSGMLTDPALIAGNRGEESVSNNIVNNSAAGLQEEFVPDISLKWECRILMTIMVITCMSGCWDIFIDAAFC